MVLGLLIAQSNLYSLSKSWSGIHALGKFQNERECSIKGQLIHDKIDKTRVYRRKSKQDLWKTRLETFLGMKGAVCTAAAYSN
jgi:hypothetical protein